MALRLLKRLFWLSPVGWWVGLRRRMTGGSVTLLILAILSLNIIWGYPWVGMLSACLSLMVVGGIAGAVMRPRLRMDVRTDAVAMVGRPVAVVATMSNPTGRAALDLRMTPLIRPTVGRTSDQVFVTPAIGSGQSVDFSFRCVFARRGIWLTPAMRVESHFPFRLFRTINRVPSTRSIAVTPAPAEGHVDSAAGSVARAIEQIVARHRGGDQMNYIGNTEYRVGMPVRRWDFASWARLGKPIVRQYATPAKPVVRLIADVSASGQTRRRGRDRAVEAVLARAVMAIEQLAGAGVGLEVHVVQNTTAGSSPEGNTDRISIATAIAGAKPVAASTTDRRLLDLLGQPAAGGGPTLILSTRPPRAWSEKTPPHVVDSLDNLLASPLVRWHGSLTTTPPVTNPAMTAPPGAAPSQFRVDRSRPAPAIRSGQLTATGTGS